MKMVTTEVLENLTLLSALVQKTKPALEPIDISIGLIKMQKLAVTLRGRDSSAITNEMTRADYDEKTHDFRKKFCEIATSLGIAATGVVKSNSVPISINNEPQRLW